MKSIDELFSQAGDFIATLPRPVQPKKGHSTADLVENAFMQANRAWDAKNKRLATQQLATAIDLVVVSIGANNLDHELVFDQLAPLQTLDDEFAGIFKTEVKRSIAVLCNYGRNLPALYSLSRQDKSLINQLLRTKYINEIFYSAEGDSSMLEVLKCAGTYSRMRLMVHFQTYETDIAKTHAQMFGSTNDDTDLQKLRDEHGPELAELFLLANKAYGGEELSIQEAYSATACIRNAVGNMFTSLTFNNRGLHDDASSALIDYHGVPTNDILEPIKEGDGRIFFILNPLTNPTSLMAKPMQWASAFNKEKKTTSVVIITRPLIPELDDE